MTAVTLNRAAEKQAYTQRLLAVQEVLARTAWSRLFKQFGPIFVAQYTTNGEHGLLLALEQFNTAVSAQLVGTWRKTMTAFGAHTVAKLVKGRGIDKEAKAKKESYVDALIRDWTNKFLAEKANGITGTLKLALKDIIHTGTNSNKTITEIGKDINDRFKTKTSYEAYRIARTEVHGAAMAGVDAGAAATGLELKKQWLSAEDDRTREAHAIADGQVVGMEESFTVDGEQLRFPGDPFGSASNVINCRCTTLYIPAGG